MGVNRVKGGGTTRQEREREVVVSRAPGREATRTKNVADKTRGGNVVRKSKGDRMHPRERETERIRSVERVTLIREREDREATHKREQTDRASGFVTASEKRKKSRRV